MNFYLCSISSVFFEAVGFPKVRGIVAGANQYLREVGTVFSNGLGGSGSGLDWNSDSLACMLCAEKEHSDRIHIYAVYPN